jgi:hypothetical protein
MLQFLVLILVLSMVSRIYYYNVCKGKPTNFLSFSTRFFSIMYLIPLSKTDRPSFARDRANLSLYVFYIVFILIIAIGIFQNVIF